MSGHEKEGYLPSYEDSINSTSTLTARAPNHSRGQQILDSLTLARAQHIRAVADTSIIPLIEQQARHGIAQTTIAMIPSDVSLPTVPEAAEKSEFSFDTGKEKSVEATGFSTDEEPQIVRLEGQMNRTEFWRPPGIILGLKTVLEDSLNASPRISLPSPAETAPETVLQPSAKKTKRGLFERMANAVKQKEPPLSTNSTVGMSQTGTGGRVVVSVRLEEVSLRTLSDFGLYDTLSKQCIIIRVDAGC